MLKNLKISEKLYLLRKRRKETQDIASKRYGLSYLEYSLWENGNYDYATDETTDRLFGKFAVDVGKTLNVYNITDKEHCVVYRRRAKITQQEIADELGLSRSWVNAMEVGYAKSVEKLLKYWEKKNEQTYTE
jgi:transcriptional regulator with XRE-family HTH domain